MHCVSLVHKGATPADNGLVMILGSHGDYSHVLLPVAGRQDALGSLAYGAGRKWACADYMGRLKPCFTLQQLMQTCFGSVMACSNRALMYEEASYAYKDVDAVAAKLIEAVLVQPVARLRPFLTYKKS